MKTSKLFLLCCLALLAVSFSGCRRCSNDLWDDTRTAGRHISRGFRSLGGKHGDSRQVRSREAFLQCRDDEYCIQDLQAMQFDPLPDHEYANEIAMNTSKSVQSSHVPGIEAFQDPSANGELASIFVKIHFPYNSSLVKGKSNMDTIRAIALYMKNHPHTHVFVEGHCDERGAEAFNLALGARRSNSVRNLLIKEGAAPERIFTVSYGKERPIDSGHNEEAWTKNRRAQFKIFQG